MATQSTFDSRVEVNNLNNNNYDEILVARLNLYKTEKLNFLYPDFILQL